MSRARSARALDPLQPLVMRAFLLAHVGLSDRGVDLQRCHQGLLLPGVDAHLNIAPIAQPNLELCVYAVTRKYLGLGK